MSIIKSGQVLVATTTSEVNFYVAMHISSSLGSIYPKLITSDTELERVYGDFPEYEFCAQLLRKGIPLLVEGNQSPNSVANFGTLTISGDSYSGKRVREDIYEQPLQNEFIGKVYSIGNTKYSHRNRASFDLIRKVHQTFIEVKNINDKVYSKENTYCLRLDNLNSPQTPNDYFILRDTAGHRCLFSSNRNVVYQNYFDRDYYVDTTGKSYPELLQTISKVTGGTVVTRSELLRLYDSIAQQVFGELSFEQEVTISDLRETLNELGRDCISIFGSYYLPITDHQECLLRLFNKLEIKEELDVDDELHYLDGSLVDIYPYKFIYDEEVQGYIPSKASTHVGKTLYQRFLDWLTDESLINELEAYLIYSEPQPKACMIEGTSPQGDKSSISSVREFNEFVLGGFQYETKVIKFEAKYKGNYSDKIKVEISKLESDISSFCYQIKISNTVFEEEYNVCTDKSVSLDELDGSYCRPEDISEKSSLVNVEPYDYLTINGKVNNLTIDSGDYISYEEFVDEGEIRAYSLLPGKEIDKFEGYLEGGFEEVDSLYSRIIFIDNLKTFEYHPDLFLENSMFSSWYQDVTKQDVKYYFNLLMRFMQSNYSQLLLGCTDSWCLKEDLVHDEIYKLLKSYKESRLCLFKGNIELEGSTYPSYYPFILNFVEGKFLNKIDERIIHKITNLKDEFTLDLTEETRKKLIKRKINFIDYNNIDYYYTTIRELWVDPSFIIRFCLSRLTRLFLETDKLIACEPGYIRNRIEYLLSEYENIITLHSNKSYTYEIVGHKLNITVSITFPKIVNKTYIINLTLNY